MVKVVVFDLDDTLYEEIEYCRSGFTACGKFLEKESLLPDPVTAEQVSEELWRQFESGNTTQTFNGALEELKISYDVELIKRLVEAYREHEPVLSLPADSRAVLDALVSDYELALLSDGFIPAQRLKVSALGIEEYFKYMVFTEELGRGYWKPHPAGFEKILAEFGVQARRAVYVGDNIAKDFIAPNELGFGTIQLIRARGVHNCEPACEAARPDHVIEDIGELPALLEKM